MRRTNRRSTNVIDKRGSRRRRGLAGGGIGTVLLIVVALIFGINPQTLLDGLGGNVGGTSYQQQSPTSPQAQAQKAFIEQVLGQTELVWQSEFKKLGKTYKEPKLVLFSGSVNSACGHAQAAMGPFYCPGDQQVYIDYAFYDDLKRNFGAQGDFAEAYVIAHEVGHHVQTLLGLSDQVNRAKSQTNKVGANKLSVRFELQADCLAGIWAYHSDKSFKTVEPGDIQEAITAASAIGDDEIQRKTTGHVRPDSFTHGSGKQRVEWFMRGFKSADISQCDTFN